MRSNSLPSSHKYGIVCRENMESMQPPVAENAANAAYPDLHTQLAARMRNGLASHLGIQLLEARPGYLCVQMEIAPHRALALFRCTQMILYPQREEE